MRVWGYILFIALFASSCRGEDMIVGSTPNQTAEPNPYVTENLGFFLLNEGNMGHNKSTLDYFDYRTGVYTKNIFEERNPSVTYGLGDVGNDIAVWGDRVYAVINCSNLVEVMSLETAEHIAAVTIPNCRYIAFSGDYAYVSSYEDYVAKVSLESLEVVGTCAVGCEPEQMAVVGDKLYVANSGWSNAPNYETTLSVIELNSFTKTKDIEVGINLRLVELDDYGYLWVSSQGNNDNIASCTYIVNTATDTVTDMLDLPNSRMARDGDIIYVCSTQYSNTTGQTSVRYAVVNTRTQSVTDTNFIKDGSESNITIPYGLAANSETGEIFITDAGNYTTPGRIYCYEWDGTLKWSATTGDIPSAIAFTPKQLQDVDSYIDPDDSDDNDDDASTAYITKVLEYLPAPGQYTNNYYPTYEDGDTQQDMNDKAFAAIGGATTSIISLGGWGGYVIVGFDHSIENRTGYCDFRVVGNAISTGGEPGVIMVSRDANGNGLADDTWYEIVGSEASLESWYDLAVTAGNTTTKTENYTVTYSRSDNEYTYPKWLSQSTYTITGTRLPQNGVLSGIYTLYPYSYGYADSTVGGDAIDIGWAVDGDGSAANLDEIDFIKIYTGVEQTNGVLGECSTEITRVEDLHILEEEVLSSETAQYK